MPVRSLEPASPWLSRFSQSVGNLTSLRIGGGPSQLSFRNSFSGRGCPSNCNPNISIDSRSKFSTPGQTVTRDVALGRFRNAILCYSPPRKHLLDGQSPSCLGGRSLLRRSSRERL